MTFGQGKYAYQVQEGWGELPAGWKWGWIAAVACDSQDRVYVYSRSEHPMVVFDPEGRFLASWGEGILPYAHGLFIDAEDNLYCTEYDGHCVHKFSPSGELLLTLGTPGHAAVRDGDPFNRPTDAARASSGELYVSDGYGNARVHKFSADGKLLLSWGEHGSGPGQFNVSHCVRVDRMNRVWVCDRENNRIQIFDRDGRFLAAWPGIPHPDSLCFDPTDDVLYVAHLTQQVSIYSLDGERLTEWGGGRPSQAPGEFLGGPHGICVDSRGDLYVSEVQADGRLHKYIRR